MAYTHSVSQLQPPGDSLTSYLYFVTIGTPSHGYNTILRADETPDRATLTHARISGIQTLLACCSYEVEVVPLRTVGQFEEFIVREVC